MAGSGWPHTKWNWTLQIAVWQSKMESGYWVSRCSLLSWIAATLYANNDFVPTEIRDAVAACQSDQNFDVAGQTSPQRKAEPPNSSAETTAFAAGELTSKVFESSTSKNPASHAVPAPPAEQILGGSGTVAGRFRIQKLLGRGGMGSVYLAHDEQLDRPVALKIPRLPDDPESAEKSVSRFLREARAAAILSHPNICPIYDVGRDGDTHFIAMGFVTGRPLTSYVTSENRQPSRQVALVVRKIALALAACASEGHFAS